MYIPTRTRTKHIMKNLLALAEAKPGQFVGQVLTNNLKVEVRCQPAPYYPGQTRIWLALPEAAAAGAPAAAPAAAPAEGRALRLTLRISRSSSYPTSVEWRTVAASFPHPVHAEPARLFTNRCCLSASWTILQKGALQ